ncbi:MAG TPA: hypothetical protein VNW68_08470, partial [Candidatus Limnocylindria bacterium]|nr:hypothetical protein [Candidatus Limnocylindria bacterium]
RLGSPLHQFRLEVTNGFNRFSERLSAIEAAATTRVTERARSTARGADFEDVVEPLLAEICRGTGDLLERTVDEAGAVIRSKKGDFLLVLDERLTRGADVRIVVECKDRPISARAIREELAAAKQNRGAAAALVCFSTDHAPAAVAPFHLHGTDVYCVVDRSAPDSAIVEAAVRLARLVALAQADDGAEADVDVAAVSAAIEAVRGQLDAVRAMKTQLTSIGTVSQQVSGGLDRLREQILGRLVEAESALRTPARGDAGG